MPLPITRPDAGFELASKATMMLIGAALLALAIGALVWLNLQQIGATQRAIIDEALPAMDAAQRVAHFNLSISERVDELAGASSAAAIERRVRELDSAFVDLRRLVGRLVDQRFDATLRGKLAAALDALDAQRADLAQTAARALALQRQQDAALAAHDAALSAFEAHAETLVAGASAATSASLAALYKQTAAGTATPSLLQTLDHLADVDIDLLERSHELQRAGLALGSALARIADADDGPALAALREQAATALATLERRVADISDDEHRLRTNRHLRQLATSMNDDGVFARRLQQLEMARQIDAQRAGIRRLAARMNAQAGALIDAASRSIAQASGDSRQAVNRGMFGFLVSIALLGLGLAAGFWAIFRHHLRHRVKAVASALDAFAAGDYDMPLRLDTSGPLAPLSDALEKCRIAHLRRQHRPAAKTGD